MDLWFETLKVLALPIIMILWYHYWVWRMSKEQPPGGGDAKAVKGKDYFKPDIASIIKHRK